MFVFLTLAGYPPFMVSLSFQTQFVDLVADGLLVTVR